MRELDRLLAGNERYVPGHRGGLAAGPARQLAVVTCMDARIEPLRVLGLEVGDAHVIRTAGGRVGEEVLASLAVSAHLLGVRTVMVMHHTNCGLVGVTEEELRRRTGAEVAFRPISDHEASFREDVQRLTSNSYLGPVTTTAGLLLDTGSGVVSSRPRRAVTATVGVARPGANRAWGSVGPSPDQPVDAPRVVP
jgi:carbonic anhydrase